MGINVAESNTMGNNVFLYLLNLMFHNAKINHLAVILLVMKQFLVVCLFVCLRDGRAIVLILTL